MCAALLRHRVNIFTLLLPSLPDLLSQAEATTDDLSKVKRNIMTVLVSQPDGRVALEDLGSAYQQCINQALDVSRLQGVSSTVELVQSCKRELEVGWR